MRSAPYCTRCNANMIDYCTGYCELESGESCGYASHVQTSDPNVIGQCICKCGVDQDIMAYNDVPCGMDLMRKACPCPETAHEASSAACRHSCPLA